MSVKQGTSILLLVNGRLILSRISSLTYALVLAFFPDQACDGRGSEGVGEKVRFSCFVGDGLDEDLGKDGWDVDLVDDLEKDGIGDVGLVALVKDRDEDGIGLGEAGTGPELRVRGRTVSADSGTGSRFLTTFRRPFLLVLCTPGFLDSVVSLESSFFFFFFPSPSLTGFFFFPP